MKKRLLIFGILAWFFVIIAAVYIWLQGGISLRANVLKEESHSLVGIQNLTVTSDSIPVRIRAGSSDELRIVQYGGSSMDPDELFTVESKDDEDSVFISVKQNLKILNWDLMALSERLLIEVPTDWHGNVEVSLKSGSIRLEDRLDLQDVAFRCTSGGIRLAQGLSAENVELSTTSGGIRSYGDLNVTGVLNGTSKSGGIVLDAPIKANGLNLKASSGRIRLGETETAEFTLSSSSGGINVAGITGSGSAKASSGRIRIGLSDPLGKVDLNTTSGAIRITVGPSLAFHFNGTCTSGSIRSDFPLEKNEGGNRASATVGNEPNATITAQATSGGIRLNRGEH